MKMKRKGLCALALASLAVGGMLAGCGSSSSGSNGEVVVYNWGEYIDPDTITMFEEETGIKVIYDEFETNEIMYPKVESGASEYDGVNRQRDYDVLYFAIPKDEVDANRAL